MCQASKQASEQASKQQAASSKQASLRSFLYDWYVSPIRSGLIRWTDGFIECTCTFVIQPLCTKCRRALMQSNPVRSDKADGWIHCMELQMSVEFATKFIIIWSISIANNQRFNVTEAPLRLASKFQSVQWAPSPAQTITSSITSTMSSSLTSTSPAASSATRNIDRFDHQFPGADLVDPPREVDPMASQSTERFLYSFVVCRFSLLNRMPFKYVDLLHYPPPTTISRKCPGPPRSSPPKSSTWAGQLCRQ